MWKVLNRKYHLWHFVSESAATKAKNGNFTEKRKSATLFNWKFLMNELFTWNNFSLLNCRYQQAMLRQFRWNCLVAVWKLVNINSKCRLRFKDLTDTAMIEVFLSRGTYQWAAEISARWTNKNTFRVQWSQKISCAMLFLVDFRENKIREIKKLRFACDCHDLAQIISLAFTKTSLSDYPKDSDRELFCVSADTGHQVNLSELV